MVTLTELWVIWNLLKEAYRYRLRLLRIAKLGLHGGRVTSGGFSLFFGGVFEAAIPVSIWNFYQQTPITSATTLVSSIVAVLGVASFFAVIGMYLIGLGVVAISPNSRLGRRFRNAWFSKKRRKIDGGPPVQMLFRITISRLLKPFERFP